MDSKDLRFMKILFIIVLIGIIYMLYNLNNGQPEMKSWKVDNGVDITSTPTPTPIEGYSISVSRSKPTDWISPTPTFTPEPTATPTPTFVPTNTPTPKPTNTPKPTKTPTPKPTKTPTPRPTQKVAKSTYPCEKTVPRGGHSWKPWAHHTAVNLKTSPQYRMQKNYAKTDPSNGLRYCIDPYGEKRYCVALNDYWCGGDSSDIGRCFDVVMANGATIKCCLGDTKRTEKSQNGEGKFGSKGELLEFQAEETVLKKYLGKAGDISNLGGAFVGEAVKIIAYDYFIEGFGK